MPQLQIINGISPSVVCNPWPSNQLNCDKPNLSKIPKSAHACDTESQKTSDPVSTNLNLVLIKLSTDSYRIKTANVETGTDVVDCFSTNSKKENVLQFCDSEHEESSLKDQLNIFTALFSLFNTEDSESNRKLQFLNDISSPVRNSPLPSNQLDCVKKNVKYSKKLIINNTSLPQNETISELDFFSKEQCKTVSSKISSNCVSLQSPNAALGIAPIYTKYSIKLSTTLSAEKIQYNKDNTLLYPNQSDSLTSTKRIGNRKFVKIKSKEEINRILKCLSESESLSHRTCSYRISSNNITKVHSFNDYAADNITSSKTECQNIIKFKDINQFLSNSYLHEDNTIGQFNIKMPSNKTLQSLNKNTVNQTFKKQEMQTISKTTDIKLSDSIKFPRKRKSEIKNDTKISQTKIICTKRKITQDSETDLIIKKAKPKNTLNVGGKKRKLID
ncbi:hypothetical protein CDAR_26751 [Caerostris darwini]|uniref:Uncharacterized protein n=1 Tax=Caerostris darwini TaxID=1538125 RepID=A0AAV4M3M6_9ARAC|nr:hypothetical protein CDAR_26751 [Caerostris darwini]